MSQREPSLGSIIDLSVELVRDILKLLLLGDIPAECNEEQQDSPKAAE
jgi:hypothetical protein